MDLVRGAAMGKHSIAGSVMIAMAACSVEPVTFTPSAIRPPRTARGELDGFRYTLDRA
jgi:hypothetical protein